MITISSRQCFGGGGSSSGADVNLNSTPHTPHRNLMFTLRISPGGGGGGSGVVNDRNSEIPVFHRTTPISTPVPTQTTVENAIGSG